MKTVAEELKDEILATSYFYEIFEKTERIVAENFFGNSKLQLEHKEISDLLRYADILSHSEDFYAKNIAYRSVALLVEHSDVLNSELRLYAEAILSKLGNFPGLKYLGDNFQESVMLPIEREFERGYKKSSQKTIDGEYVFTDSQFKVRKGIEDYDFFSFSGPTSIGKSFIIKDYIRSLIQTPQLNNGCIVILVPTRALISQLVEELRKDIKNMDINISAYPNYSPYIRKKYSRTIFIFTPERLLSYVANDAVDVKYLFVDEAQKIVSENDSRSSLYYHAIYETVRKFATKIVFASPNIPNPNIFLNIFEKDQRGSISVKEQTVSQNRYFVDLLAHRVSFFSDINKENVEQEIDTSHLASSLYELLKTVGGNVNNIIYCNGTGETVRRACEFAKRLEYVDKSKELIELTKYLREHVHKEYYLIECLKKGVAFHHGKMPQQVRVKVEEYYKKKETNLKYLFCTSTLLEGVNLPAKNIFVVNDYHGTSKFKKIDFENLIGRAGRLTREFSGNIICVRDTESRWKTENALIRRTNLEPVDSFLVNTKKAKTKEFTNIAKVLSGKPMSDSLRVGEAENLNHYASIMLLHHMDNEGSLLKAGFLYKASNAQQILQMAKRNNNVPSSIIRVSSTIKPASQNKALDYIRGMGEAVVLPDLNKETDVESVLGIIYDLYSWESEESSGNSPLIPKAMIKNHNIGKARLSYWAMLMKHWMNGEPLNVLISNSIRYHAGRGYIWLREEGGLLVKEDFIASQKQVNAIIEQVMSDIENGIRFRIEKYLLNYYLLCRFQFGDLAGGTNWSEMIEYGTSDKKCIELQNIGFTRAAATFLIEKQIEFISFSHEGELLDIDRNKLDLAIANDNEFKQEILEVLR